MAAHREDPDVNGYEAYLRTPELLSLQAAPEEMIHHDELLFQTVHQASELWMKLAAWEIESSLDGEVEASEIARRLRRASACLERVMTATDMLDSMDPWDFQEIRRKASAGSGFGSPGFRALHGLAPRLWQRFCDLRGELSLAELYQERKEHATLHELAELLVDLDQRVIVWRLRHLRTVERAVGGDAVGTQGTPISALATLAERRWFPELWAVRSELTRLAGFAE